MAVDLVLAMEESFLLDRIGDNDTFPLLSLDGVFMLFASTLTRKYFIFNEVGCESGPAENSMLDWKYSYVLIRTEIRSLLSD